MTRLELWCKVTEDIEILKATLDVKNIAAALEYLELDISAESFQHREHYWYQVDDISYRLSLRR